MKIENTEVVKDIVKKLGIKGIKEKDCQILDVITIGNDILREKNVDVIDFKEIRQFVVDMTCSLYYYEGCGFAAPQLGRNINLFIVEIIGIDEKEEPYIEFPLTVFINPKIIKYSEETQEDYEGCLSIPGFDAKVKRSKEITIEYYDLFGKKCVEIYSDFVARAVQHEYDHLHGIIYTDIADMKTFTTRQNLIDKT